MQFVQVPKKFFDDHAERELPTPHVIRETSRYYLVNRDDEAVPELIDDAMHYADGVDQADRGLIASAKAVLRAFNA